MLTPAPCCGLTPVRVDRPEDLPAGFVCEGCRRTPRPKAGSVVPLRELRAGARVRLRVDAVGRIEVANESRVRVVLDSTGEVRSFRTADGRDVEFKVPGRHLDLSPNTEVEVIL